MEEIALFFLTDFFPGSSCFNYLFYLRAVFDNINDARSRCTWDEPNERVCLLKGILNMKTGQSQSVAGFKSATWSVSWNTVAPRYIAVHVSWNLSVLFCFFFFLGLIGCRSSSNLFYAVSQVLYRMCSAAKSTKVFVFNLWYWTYFLSSF